MCRQAGKGRQRKAGAHVRDWVACRSFWCEKVKAKLVVLVTGLLGKEEGEARGGVSTGFGAGKSSARVLCDAVTRLRDVADREA